MTLLLHIWLVQQSILALPGIWYILLKYIIIFYRMDEEPEQNTTIFSLYNTTYQHSGVKKELSVT